MLETLSVLAGVIVGAATLWQGARLCWRIVGGWHGLRHNPWVWRPLVGSLAAFGIAMGAAAFVDHAKAAGDTGIARVTAGWVAAIAFCLWLIGIGWALLAGMRRIRRIEELLHFHEANESIEGLEGFEIAELSEAEGKAVLRVIAEQLVTLQDLRELWRLLPPSGGVPELEWLTREWVRARVAVLGGSKPAEVESARYILNGSALATSRSRAP